MLQLLRPRLCTVAAASRQMPSRRPILPSRRAYTSPARLSGRTCMITGGTSGIGYAVAERFLQEGAGRVILVGRSYERLVNAAKGLGAGVSPDKTDGAQQQSSEEKRVSLLVSDVSNPEGETKISEKDMVSEVDFLRQENQWKLNGTKAEVDILINAAGISNTSVLPRIKPSDISLTLRTNLEGAIATSRLMLRSLILRRSANKTGTSDSEATKHSRCIINISSLLAHKGGTGAVPYAASKAGLLGLTRSLAVEAAALLKDKGVMVRSNVIVPGYIETPMTADFSEAETARLKESIPIRRFGTPQEIADAAVFLALNEYANNCVLNLDGGLSAV